jgi:uncharacterized protein YggE
MKKLLLTAALLVAASAAPAQEIQTYQYENAIQVNGRAERKITPDEIWVAITIKDSDNKNLGVDGLETRMKREFTALGIDVAGALKVTSMANAPRRRNQVDTSRSYELKVGDAATLGRVFEVLGEMEIPEAGVTRLSHSRIEQFRSEVRIEAVKNAQKIATELAGAVDQRLMEAVWIMDNGYYESSPVPIYKTRAVSMDMAFASGAAEGGAEALDMREITLTANVTAKFRLWVR